MVGRFFISTPYRNYDCWLNPLRDHAPLQSISQNLLFWDFGFFLICHSAQCGDARKSYRSEYAYYSNINEHIDWTSIVLRFHRLHGWSLISLLPSNADPLSITDLTSTFSTIKFLFCQWSPFQEEMAHTAQVKFREPSPTISLQDATWFEWLFLDRGRFTPFHFNFNWSF